MTLSPVRVGVRTGDTPAGERRAAAGSSAPCVDHHPRESVAAPEPGNWRPLWRGVEHIIVDEVHALAPTKRGADLAVSLERLAAYSQRDPIRVGLSATCRACESAVRFLVGRTRTCRVVQAPPPRGTPPIEIAVESLIQPGETPHRGLSYRRLLKRSAAVHHAQPHDCGVRQYPRLRREADARPAAGTVPRGRARAGCRGASFRPGCTATACDRIRSAGKAGSAWSSPARVSSWASTSGRLISQFRSACPAAWRGAFSEWAERDIGDAPAHAACCWRRPPLSLPVRRSRPRPLAPGESSRLTWSEHRLTSSASSSSAWPVPGEQSAQRGL